MAPPGLPPTRNRDVLRQARVQEAVVRSGRAPVAPVLFTDAGAPPEVPPLFAMAFVEGESFEPLLDAAAELPPPATIRGRQLAAARALAGLHSIAPGTVGLADEPEVTLVDEVERWARIFETVPDDPPSRVPGTGHGTARAAARADAVDRRPRRVPPRQPAGPGRRRGRDHRLGALDPGGPPRRPELVPLLRRRRRAALGDPSDTARDADPRRAPRRLRGRGRRRRSPTSSGSTPTPASRWRRSPRW